MTLNFKLEYFPGKMLDVEFKSHIQKSTRGDKPRLWGPEPNVLDNMSDEEYVALVETYRVFYARFWPLGTCRVPRRMTKKERLKENTS